MAKSFQLRTKTVTKAIVRNYFWQSFLL